VDVGWIGNGDTDDDALLYGNSRGLLGEQDEEEEVEEEEENEDEEVQDIVPTYRPTTSTWSPTSSSSQSSWVPTYGATTTYPTEGGSEDSSHHSTPHARVACFYGSTANMRMGNCNHLQPPEPKTKRKKRMSSIPLHAKEYRAGEDDEPDENDYGETDTCEYPAPEFQPDTPAPPTCNDIHSMGFDPRMFEQRDDERRFHSEDVKYITMGGAKCIWKVQVNDDETFIFKSHKNSRFLKRQFWDQNLRDALISGGMGNAQLESVLQSNHSLDDVMTTKTKTNDGSSSEWNHILPMYHYCALANIVPFAQGNLEEYISDHNKLHDKLHENDEEKDWNARRFGPMETLHLALQAARGLYQAQLYRDGRATFVHADLNPSQFLVFLPDNDDNDNNNSKLPILQINDFNQGRFLTRSITQKKGKINNNTNENCPFRSCSKNVRGNRYHTPERFLGCVDQDERIDTFSLGSVFFYLLTNGFHPHYDVHSYDKAIKTAKVPHVPNRLDLDHPAYDALREVMERCMVLELRDRPSTYEVVKMLEKKLSRIEIILNES